MTWTWPLQPAPAPIPIVGMRSRSVMAAASCSGTSSSTIANAPASWTASASASSDRAWSRVLPWTRTLPSALIAWGVRPMWPMTGMPARTSVSIIRAVRTPPSTLTAWAPASRRKPPGVLERLVGRRVDQERHVADDERALARRATTAFVWWSMSAIVTRTVVLVAEDDPADRVADEQQRDAGLVEELRGREVVGGQHRDALAVGVAAWRCRRRSGGGRSRVVALMLAPGAGSVLRQSARPRRARPARGRRGRAGGRRPRAWRAAAGRPACRRRRGSSTRFVSVPKPEPASATSLATSRSTPLRASLSAARSSEPVSAANPTRTGVGRSGAAGRRAVAVEAAAIARPRRGCPASASSSSGRARRRASSFGRRRARPEVGDGGGHDEGVEAGRVGIGRASRSSAARRSAVDSTRTTVRAPRSGSGTSMFAGDERHRAPRGRAPPRATATPIFPVERLPMKRTGSIGSRVPPAVTTTCRPARSASRPGPTRGGRAAGSGCADRPVADGRDDRVDDRVELGQPPDARLARRQRPRLGLDDRVAEVVAQPRDVRARRRVRHISPSIAGATTTGAAVARQVAVTTSSARPLAIAPSQCAVAGATTIASARVGERRCGRSARRAAGRAGRSRPGGATAPRTRAGRRSGSRRGSA